MCRRSALLRTRRLHLESNKLIWFSFIFASASSRVLVNDDQIASIQLIRVVCLDLVQVQFAHLDNTVSLNLDHKTSVHLGSMVSRNLGRICLFTWRE